MTRIGEHFYNPLRQIEVQKHNLQIWPGYTTAIHEFEDGLFLVVDVTHKILRCLTCWELLNNFYQRCRDRFKEEAEKALVGNIVLTRYNNRSFKIDEILWDDNPKSTFNCHGETITYVEYYKRHYNIQIRDDCQPLLLHRLKQKKSASPTQVATEKPDVICLIPELCFLTGLSEDIKNDNQLKRELASMARLTPSARVDQLRSLVDTVKSNEKAYKHLTDWGLALEDELTELMGRTLLREKIIFKNREVALDEKYDWTKPCGNEEVLKSISINNWICVFPRQTAKCVENFIMSSIDAGKRIGISIAMPMALGLNDDRPETYYNMIRENSNQYTQIVMIVFPMLSDTRYQRVKRLCCIEKPVPSQVIVAKTINKPDNVLRTIAQKVVLQMNVKLGGELWRIPLPMNKIMVVGIDVYHQNVKKYKSLAGFVSSLNDEQTRWYSKVCFQMTGQELIDSLKIAFAQALRKYQEMNNFLPQKIFIYRDGVSEGQISTVIKHEIAQLRTCFSADYNPMMAFIIVQKRISTRILQKVRANEYKNASPGSIVDHTITSKTLYDFFLVSQLVNQGTVTPTHYIVVDDNTQMSPDRIQRLSYKLTHMYYNWSGTVRVPAPCQVSLSSSTFFLFYSILRNFKIFPYVL